MDMTPKTDREWAAAVERRLARLERANFPWQIQQGPGGDLIAYNVDTGQATVIAARHIDNQGGKK